VIFREDLEEIFGKRAWDPELTENLLPIQFLTGRNQNRF
jgi:cell division protease FtsH